MGEILLVVLCFSDRASVFPSPRLETAAAEKQKHALLLAVRDNHAEGILHVALHAHFCLEAFSCVEVQRVAERKGLH